MPDLTILFQMLQFVLKDRTQLALENIALRQQLTVYKRTVKRPKIEDRDRIFWMSVMGMLKEWKEALRLWRGPFRALILRGCGSALIGSGGVMNIYESKTIPGVFSPRPDSER